MRDAIAAHQAVEDQLRDKIMELQLRFQEALFKNAARRLKYGPQVDAIIKWRETAAQMSAEMKVLRRGLLRMMHLQLSKALGHWLELHRKDSREALLMRRALMRMMRRQLAMSLGRWVEWAEAPLPP